MPKAVSSSPEKLFFSEYVKQLRKEKHISQEDIAKQLNVSLKTYQNWENKKACPSIDDIYSVCSILDCDVDYLFGKQSLPRKRYSTIHDETGLSQAAIIQIMELNDSWGYAPILSALFESSSFIQSLHKIYSALWCRKSDVQRMADNWVLEDHVSSDYVEEMQKRANDISQDILRMASRYSSEFVIVPRLAQSMSFLQEAKDNFGDAIKDTLRQLELNHAMDEDLLRDAQTGFRALIKSNKQETE